MSRAVHRPLKSLSDTTAKTDLHSLLFDYIELTPECSIFETTVPQSWVGRSVVELAVRQKYRINILATRTENGPLELLPGPTHTFQEDERIYILGANRDVQKFISR